MHLLIPFASALSDAASHVLRDLALPNLSALLARLTLAQRDDADAYTLSPPHERALAAAAGWQGADGCLPFAAQAAAHDGLEAGDLAWGLVTPSHWHVGRDHVTLADPAALQLSEAESRAAFDAVRELFESEGFRLEWGAPMRWYAAHESLVELPCASLDRVIGRNVELWMRGSEARSRPAKLVRRLQSELQLLLYPHALNDEREQRGALTLNSFWLSGCGRAQREEGTPPRVDASLRAPLLAEDWAGWAEAWRAVDAGPIAELLAAARAGDAVALTLCGDRGAHRFESVAQSMWQRLGSRFKSPEPHAVLEAL
ncbi:MAG TPA: hypothetical protein VFA35_07780 [Burkholderiaceae bacterium]|nr:hypothetical protein [Burkholderiaceae bacterium]